MKRLAVGYVVDHPRRDLPGAVQFARSMAERGADTFIIPLYEQALDVPLLPIDAIVVNYARPANLQVVQAYKAMDLPVYVLDTEGGNHTVAGSNTPERLAELLRERGFSSLLSGYFFWGPALREVFENRCGMPASSLFTTGCPRFDYASARWRPALIRPSSNEYVLVNTNFALVNPRFTGSEEKERSAMINAGWEANYVDRLMRDLKEAMHRVVETVSRLAGDLPAVRFLLRPHPFEDAAFYVQRLNGKKNVTVNGEGDVMTVLANAACLLHLNCATAVEAVMLGRLPISFEHLNTECLLNHAPLPSNVSYHARSYDELLDSIRDAPAASRKFDFSSVHRQYIYPWFYQNDGGAADRMADILVSAVGPRNGRSFSRALRASRNNPGFVHFLQGISANVCGSLAYSALRSALEPKRRDKQIRPSSISEDLATLAAIDGRQPPLVRRAIHPLTGAPLASIHCSAP